LLASLRSLPWEYALRQGCSQKPQENYNTDCEFTMTHSSHALVQIERAISRERLKRYLTATGNNLAAAVSLYEQNVAVSEAVFGLLHGLEVAIRNSMHEALAVQFGTPRWFQSPVTPLTQYGLDKVASAIRDAGGSLDLSSINAWKPSAPCATGLHTMNLF
jgi:hypothetical protein